MLVYVPAVLKLEMSDAQGSTWSRIRHCGTSCVDDRDVVRGYMMIVRNSEDIRSVELRVELMNVNGLRQYFDYLVLYIYMLETGKSGDRYCSARSRVLATLSLDRTVATITLTDSMFRSSYDLIDRPCTNVKEETVDENSIMLRIAIAYKTHVKVLYSEIPTTLKVSIVSVS